MNENVKKTVYLVVLIYYREIIHACSKARSLRSLVFYAQPLEH